jgi:hypothetical protein
VPPTATVVCNMLFGETVVADTPMTEVLGAVGEVVVGVVGVEDAVEDVEVDVDEDVEVDVEVEVEVGVVGGALKLTGTATSSVRFWSSELLV